MRSSTYGWLVSSICALALVGCSSTSPAAPPATVTVTPTPVVTVTETPAESPSTPDASTPAPEATASEESSVKVPNGVGMNYQAAQDLWRAAGLVVLPATDATGANRLPIIDSNWVVLAQDLKPGSKVASGAGITATVKKYTDK